MLHVETHICFDERGVAWIDNVNVKVMDVVLEKLAHGDTPEVMHQELPHLSLAQIHAALAFYYDNQAEFDAQIERDTREVAEMRRQAGDSPFVKRLKAEGRLP